MACLQSWQPICLVERRATLPGKFRRIMLVLLAIALAGGAGILALSRQRLNLEAPPDAGVARETEMHIAPEISGRLAAVYVRAGQPVKRGDLLALLSNPELAASVVQSKAALEQSRTDRNNVFAGVRQEEVNI